MVYFVLSHCHGGLGGGVGGGRGKIKGAVALP